MEVALSEGGSRWRRLVAAWLVLLAGVVMAGVAGLGIIRIHDTADERLELQVLLGQLGTAAYHQSALEWQAVAEDRLSAPVREERHEVDVAAAELADQLAERDPTSAPARAVQLAFGHYDAAVDREFALLANGELEAAEEVDEERVDPAFDQLSAALEAADRHYGLLADQAARQASLGTALLLLMAAVIIGVLFWRFQRARSRAVKRVAYQALQHQALHDGLTGLPNRTLLGDRTSQAIRLADRELVPAALLLIDLDRFKEINDTLGHHYGDQLLVQVGQRLQATLRKVDTVARLGGDEFVVLLPRIASSEGAVAVANKLQAGLQEPFTLDGLALEVEASIGLALYPEHGSTPEELLQRADIAMYAAKETHAGFMLFDPKLDQHSPKRLALLGELRRAIEDQQLILHYQPKVDAHTGQLLGVEALVRWQHPTHGLVPPDEFIPLAERTGLITPLTHYVLEAALRQCRAWQLAGQEIPVAVNVSARRLLDLGFPDEVATLLASCQVPAQLLVIELTESTIMTDPIHATEILGRLDQMGVQLAIDDFGTGYSSMAYLKNLPVHELKVDRSFVAHMTSNSSDAVIVHSTVELGRNLGLRVVAEGVEDSLTLDHLDLLGCHAVQGYHISRPIPADELIRWLQQHHTATAAEPPDR